MNSATARWCVLAGQAGEFLIEALEAEVDAEALGVLAEDGAHVVQFAPRGSGQFDGR
jgi:hypothetical protein